MKVRLSNENFGENYLDNLLVSRGVPFEDLLVYKYPTREQLSDPTDLDNIDEAASRLIKHCQKHSKIALIADSDVDGLTSSAIIYLYMNDIWKEVDIDMFIHEGKQHGVSDMVDRIVADNYKLVLIPDAGTNDKEYLDYLGDMGIESIVLDHHEYEGNGYSKYCVYVNNQTSPNYKNKSLSGAGVTWQFCRYLDHKLDTNEAFKYIDLAALGCCADVMSPLTLENRYIFDYGFSHVENPMFQLLCQKQSFGMGGKVNYTTVAFYIAPLINACVRSGTLPEKQRMYKSFIRPLEKVETNKRGHAKGEMTELATEVARELTNIKSRQTTLIEKYENIFNDRIESLGLQDNNVIVIELGDSDNFSSELNGLIATRISNNYRKPTLILRKSILDGLSKGSARNPVGSPIEDLKKLIGESPYTNYVAGHASAFGSYIEDVPNFVNWFNEHTKDLDFAEDYVDVNFERSGGDEDLSDLIYELGSYPEFWGADSPEPKIYVKNIHVNTSAIQIIGKTGDTFKFEYNGIVFIKFHASEDIEQILEHSGDITINIVGKPNLNEWAGRTTPQIIIESMEYSKNDICSF